MAYRDWLPGAWLGSADEDNPFGALRRQIDTIFDDFDKGIFAREGQFAVRTNVSETDDEICITAELPGITTDDVEVDVSGNRISIRGEKKSETEEKKDEEGRQFHRVERYSGSFERTMRLPYEIDPDKVKAEVKDGVMTVTLPKPPEAVKATRKIEVKAG